MRSPTLCLAALVAVLFVVSSNGMPCGQDYVKEEKSSSAASSATSSSNSEEEVIKANGPCGQFSKEKSSSSNQAACNSASKNKQSFEAGNSKDGSFVKKDSSSDSASSAAAASSNSHEKISSDSGSGKFSKESSKSTSQAAAATSAKSQDSYEASNCGGKGSYVKAKKSSENAASAASATTASQEQIQSNSCNGDYSKKASNSATKAVATSSTSNSDSYEAYNGGGGGISGGSGSGSGGHSSSGKSCGCTTKSLTIEEIKKIYAQKSGEDKQSWYTRIFTEASKTKENYSELILKIYQAYPDQDCWGNTEYFNTVKDCYTKIYGKKPCETEEVWYKRLCNKYQFESDNQYGKRLRVLYILFHNLSLWSNEKYYPLTEKVYKIWYKKTCAETSEEDYFKNMLTKYDQESDTEYAHRMLCAWKTYPSLKVWYTETYISLMTECYTKMYSKQKGESEVVYYKRFLDRQPWETSNECYSGRLRMLNILFPNLAVWTSKKYSENTSVYYKTYYKKSSIDSSEDTYFKRITMQFGGESKECYMNRMNIIETEYSSLSLWYSKKSYSYVEKYYSLWYAKKSCESVEQHIQRIFTKGECDITNFYGKIHLIYLSTISYSFWCDATYFEKYTKAYYENYYKKGDQESCTDWFVRAMTLNSGETKENGVKRMILIKKATSNCGCWTSDCFSKVKCSEGITSDYLELIKKQFFTSDVQYEKKSSSSSSCASSASSSEEDSEVVIKRAGC